MTFSDSTSLLLYLLLTIVDIMATLVVCGLMGGYAVQEIKAGRYVRGSLTITLLPIVFFTGMWISTL